jgi:hypothetical protein
MTMKSTLALALFLLVVGVIDIAAQTPSFTYQGRLTETSALANGNYDFEFALFDALAGGAQIGTTQTLTGVTVTAGTFTVVLNFGVAAFPGADRFLEIRVKRAVDPTYTTLTPRQKVTSTPYAIRAADADKLDGIDSAGFIRNQATQQMADLNINGRATANILSATTQFNIGANRVLSVAGTNNLFAGVNAGTANTRALAMRLSGQTPDRTTRPALVMRFSVQAREEQTPPAFLTRLSARPQVLAPRRATAIRLSAPLQGFPT